MRHQDVPVAARRTRRATNVAAAAVVAFALLSLGTTQIAAIRAVAPWTDDPFDAVTWFVLLILAVDVAVTWVRSVRYRGPGEIRLTARRRIHRGVAVAVVAVLAGVLSDIAAITSVGMPGAAPPVAVAILALLTIAGEMAVMAAVLLVVAVRSTETAPFESTEPSEPDAIDDALALLRDASALVRQRAHRTSRALDRAAVAASAFLERSRLSPRRHRSIAAVALSLAGGLAATGWHALVEGPWASPAAAAVFGGLAAAWILAAVGGLSGYLRLVRPA